MQIRRRHEIHFVQVGFSNTHRPLSHSRREAHSHVARATHAKTRRLRSAQYQANKISFQDQSHQPEHFTSQMPAPVDLLTTSRRDPFASLALRFNHFEHFLFDYHVTSMVPYWNSMCMKELCLDTQFACMGSEWTQLAITDIGFLQSVLLGACRSLSQTWAIKRDFFLQRAHHYKAASMRTLAGLLSSQSSFSDATVATVLTLALDELSLADPVAAQYHVKGAAKMIELNGGPQTLGLNGYLWRLIAKIKKDIGQ